MSFWDIFTVVFTISGLFFFLAGTVGILRFTDVFSRLHALTKADNVGLGLLIIGLMPQLVSAFDALQLVITWGLVIFSSAVASFLVAQYAMTYTHLHKIKNPTNTVKGEMNDS